jgi:hypothetical protein
MDVTLEAALISAAISAVVSLLTTFLLIRFGPNYEKEIAELKAALIKVFEGQSRNTELMEARFTAERGDREKAELQRTQRELDSKWRPTARIEVRAWDDTRLILKGDREFLVERVTLLNANGATLTEISLPESETARKSTGLAIQLPQSEIVKVWNDSSGPRMGQMQAAVQVAFSTGDLRGRLELPVIGKQEFVTVAPSTSQGYIRLIG